MLVKQRPPATARRGKIIALFALMLVFVVGMVAFAVDIGWIVLVRNQLQVTADAAATAAAATLHRGEAEARAKAKQIAGLNIAGGQEDFVNLDDADIVLGTWDADLGQFLPGVSPANAVRVTARQTLPLYFGAILGQSERKLAASATAIAAPRDIAFVVDLSGSMNNDTEIWATEAINGAFAGYPTIGSDLMADLYEDFGYGDYPGTVQHVGEGYIPASLLDSNAYTYLANVYLYNNWNVSTHYRIQSSHSSGQRKTRVYRWIIDYQLAAIMPQARPIPNSTVNYNYWEDYLDYVIYSSPPPPNQNNYRITGAGNPYGDSWPDLSSSAASQFRNKLGYLTYIQFMMDYGHNKKAGNNSTHVPLSRNSPDCPWRLDNDPSSPGYGLYFPPREQPTHAVRLAVMAAIDKIAEINAGLPDPTKDHVCIITFDTASGTAVRYPLSVPGCDYNAVKASLRDLQAVADDSYSTASENGLMLVREHLNAEQNPSGARPNATKMVIFLSDGIPNVKQSSSTTIDNFVTSNPEGEWFTSGGARYERNAVLMQIAEMKALRWKTHAVGVGLGADRDLMDRMARMASTGIKDPDNPTGPKISSYAEGNPADYQERLTSIFNSIVGTPSVQMVR